MNVLAEWIGGPQDGQVIDMTPPTISMVVPNHYYNGPSPPTMEPTLNIRVFEAVKGDDGKYRIYWREYD